MKRTVLLLIVSLFIVGTLVARVTVPENVMYEVPEPEPESVTDVTEEPEHTTDVVGYVEEKEAEIVSLTEMDDDSRGCVMTRIENKKGADEKEDRFSSASFLC